MAGKRQKICGFLFFRSKFCFGYFELCQLCVCLSTFLQLVGSRQESIKIIIKNSFLKSPTRWLTIKSSNSKVHYLLKSKFLSLSKYYVSLTFVSGLLDEVMSDCNGSYTTWTWLAVPAGVTILCWCVIDDEMLRDLIKGGFLLLIEVENAKPRRNVALTE